MTNTFLVHHYKNGLTFQSHQEGPSRNPWSGHFRVVRKLSAKESKQPTLVTVHHKIPDLHLRWNWAQIRLVRMRISKYK